MSLFLCSTLLLIASKYIEEKYVKSFFTNVSFLFLWSSLFQFIWIFWDRQDLPKSAYYISIIFLSATSALLFRKVLISRKRLILKLRSALNEISKFSFITAKKHIKPESEKDYQNDLLLSLKKGMDYGQS
ncbi:hypothetical protein [Tenacibaculum sp. 190524A02b]|uniref:hypothetical protein n=1 Tax=Tenacibaculum vairaonense TaxID=3137860 RepID=UPI0032B2E1CE